jgi:hypothetical protein
MRTCVAAAVLLAACCNPAAQAASARLYSNPQSAPEVFATAEVEAALRARHFSVTRRDTPDSFPFRDAALVYFENIVAHRRSTNRRFLLRGSACGTSCGVINT